MLHRRSFFTYLSLFFLLFLGIQADLTAGSITSPSATISQPAEVNQASETHVPKERWWKKRADRNQEDVDKKYKRYVILSLLLGVASVLLVLGFFIGWWGFLVFLSGGLTGLSGLALGWIAGKMGKRKKNKVFDRLRIAGMILSGLGVLSVLYVLIMSFLAFTGVIAV